MLSLAHDVLAGFRTHQNRILEPGGAGKRIATLRIDNDASNAMPFGFLQDFPPNLYERSRQIFLDKHDRSERRLLRCH